MVKCFKKLLFGLFIIIWSFIPKTLSTNGTPQIQPFNFPEALSVSQKTSVLCTVNKGIHPLYFRWLKDGKELMSKDNIDINHIKDISALTINPVFQNSTGNYTCVVTNNEGKDEYTALLVVKAPPLWLEQVKDSSTHVGTKFEAKCRASGRPSPVITWWKKGSQGNFVKLQSDIRTSGLEEGHLAISDVRESDEGHYKCEANNGVGDILVAEFHLTVYGKRRYENRKLA
ncbi:cell adhesion molecule Dscam2-like [Parasteatoda tepidariorum]|uniref:cell adhesion molecule Dscam2-like n=1 Tax=Parasteatoda tepidariorum TaxID=114398 RepID=UPI0039BD04A3